MTECVISVSGEHDISGGRDYCVHCGFKPERVRPLGEPSAADFLQAGLRHMQDRATTYDKPGGERSMGATVEAFQAITGLSMTEEQGWLFMTLLKAVRSQQGGYRGDNYEDGAAYFALTGEAAARERASER